MNEAETHRLRSDYMKTLEEEGCDLECERRPDPSTGESVLWWVILGHFVPLGNPDAKPQKRIIGEGTTILDALLQAF